MNMSQQLKRTNNSLNILGMYVSNNEKDMINVNYKEILSKADEVMYDWRNRGLTIVSKVAVLNTLIGSLFVYKMSKGGM